MFTGKVQVPGYAEKDPLTKEISYTTEFSSSNEDKDGNPTQEITGYKMVSAAYKYGNRELLLEAFEGDSSAIRGYAIVYEDGQLIAKNKDGDKVTIDLDVSELSETEAFTANSLLTTSMTYDNEGTSTSTTQTYTGSGTIEGPILVTYGDLEMIGYKSGSYKVATWYGMAFNPKTEKSILDKSTVNYVRIPGAVKITSLAGSQEGKTGTDVFTGSINLSAAKAVKVSK
jgi:hypothetical protein